MKQAARPPFIVGLVTGETIDRFDLFALCGLLEIRFDTFPSTEWEEVRVRIRKEFPDRPIIGTIRLKRDGGEWPDEKYGERVPLWEQWARSGGVDWIDVELEHPEISSRLKELRAPRVKLLISTHDFDDAPTDPEEYEEIWNRALAWEPDGVKIVTTIPSICGKQGGNDREKALYSFVERHRDDSRLCAAFAMGEAGRRTRIEAPRRGAPWSYGFAGRRSPAPGQWSIEELHRLFSKI